MVEDELHAFQAGGRGEAFVADDVRHELGLLVLQDLIAIVTKSSVVLFKTLAVWLFLGAGKGLKTKVKIGKAEHNLEGFTADEVEDPMESPALLEALRELRKK